jgi:hypothetical protein
VLSLLRFVSGLRALVLAAVLFDRGQAPAAALPELYPKGDVFCFTFYSTVRGDTPYTLTNGATAIGPYYGDQGGPLSNAVSLNCKYLYKIDPPSMAGWGPNNTNFVWPSDQTVSNEVLAILNPVKTNANIAMWDIEPEELRYWRAPELHYLALVSSIVHSNDPLHRPVYMYEPNHRIATDLTNTVVYQDLCAKGCYVNSVDPNYETNRIWARWSMEQELGAIAMANTSAVPWIVLWMAADAPPGDFGLITNWCRHDAYMGLIMGGKGIEIWSGWRGRTGFSDTNFQAYLDGYLTVARDLNGPLNLGPVFLRGQRRANVTMAITAGPTTLQTIYRGATNVYPSLTWLGTALTATNYLFVANSGAQPVTATFGNLPRTARIDLFAGTTNATPDGSFSLTMAGLAVKAFRFAPNTAPVFRSGSLSAPAATAGTAYSGSITADASDADVPYGDVLTFTKANGPAWLTVATNGAFSGMPTTTNAGANLFAVKATDSEGLYATATLTIQVEPSTPPRLAVQTDTGHSILQVSWPTSYISYVLQGQTNPFGVGLTASWWPVAGAASNHLLVPVDPQSGSAFFRLVRTP